MSLKLKYNIEKLEGRLNHLKEVETALSRNKRDKGFLAKVKRQIKETQSELNELLKYQAL